MIIDANIFLEAALDRERAEACRRFLGKVKDGSVQAAITDFHVDSILVVLEGHGMGWIEMSRFLASLFRYKGLTVHSPGLVGRLRATNVMREHRLDFDDALVVQTLRDLSRKTVISYDGHLDGIEGVARKTPEELLSDLGVERKPA